MIWMATLAWAREDLDEKMGKRDARVLEEAGSDVEASERLQELLCLKSVIWASSGRSDRH